MSAINNFKVPDKRDIYNDVENLMSLSNIDKKCYYKKDVKNSSYKKFKQPLQIFKELKKSPTYRSRKNETKPALVYKFTNSGLKLTSFEERVQKSITEEDIKKLIKELEDVANKKVTYIGQVTIQ